MMILIGLLTVILVLDCLFLTLLVLVQLPKKEAGMGQAFGGAATDALFGAGSGNALTKMTKYATVIFFALTLAISIMFNVHARNRGSGFERSLGQQTTDLSAPPAPAKNVPNTAAANAVNAGGNAAAPAGGAPVNGAPASGGVSTAPKASSPAPAGTAPAGTAPAPAAAPSATGPATK